MKNIFIISVIIVLIAGGGYYFFTKQQGSDSIVKTQNSIEESSDSITSDNSRYVEYLKDILEKSKEKRRVLFFYANWCPTCRPANTNFQENINKIPEDVILIRVNYNDSDTDAEEKALAEKYAITYQHTYVQLDSEDNVVAKWNGGQIEELLENIK